MSQLQYFWQEKWKGSGHGVLAFKLKSYDTVRRTMMPHVDHINHVYAKNGAEVSHEPTRQREQAMRVFRSSDQAQRFLTLHGLTQNLFRLATT